MASRRVASESFEREVLQSDRPTLVDFYADWCGPCRAIAPALDELAHELEGQANVVKVNVDESPDLASQFDVQTIPTFIVFRNGMAATKLVGIQSKQALAKAVAAEIEPPQNGALGMLRNPRISEPQSRTAIRFSRGPI